ncbi:hypothetical protein N7528_009209 [Penicillium herquei]|nr:hypothetical protein N7528_009209 [Penicillium herquei]
MSDANHGKLTHFLEQWKKVHTAVIEMAPSAKLISQVEGTLEENDKFKSEINKLTEELKRSKAEEERLNIVIQQMIEKFETRVNSLQEKHNTGLHRMTSSLEETRADLMTSRSEFEEASRKCMSLELELETQRRHISTEEDEHSALKTALGFVELDACL